MTSSKKIAINRYKVEIPNWDKVLFPKNNLKKSDIIDYYKKVAKYMIPFLKNRILTLHRFPDGISEDGFYQKQYQNHYPNFINTHQIKLTEGSKQTQISCNKKADLIYLAGQAAIEFHVWQSKVTSLDKPSQIIFDLDPPQGKKSFKILLKACTAIKEVLDDLSLNSYIMTTGSKGLHIIIPIKPTKHFDDIRDFAKKLADYIASQNDKYLTTALQKVKRQGRIFIDYTRNAYGQTSIVPYSLRAIDNAPIATPLDWDELETIDSAQEYTINNIFNRLARIKDPWKSKPHKPQTLKERMIKQVDDLSQK